MDSSKFAKLAITHFEEDGCYSEIKLDKLEKIFEKYIEAAYRKKIGILSLKVEVDKKNGEVWTTDRYKRKMEKLYEEMASVVKTLLVNRKAECIDKDGNLLN